MSIQNLIKAGQERYLKSMELLSPKDYVKAYTELLKIAPEPEPEPVNINVVIKEL